MLTSSVFAQSYGFNPVTYTPQPIYLPSYRPSFELLDNSIPSFRFKSNTRKSVTVSDKRTINASALELESSKIYDVLITITEYSNGDIKLTCCGIKENGQWISMQSNVASLQDIYDNLKSSDNEIKSAVLSLMEYADFIMQYGEKIFILGAK